MLPRNFHVARSPCQNGNISVSGAATLMVPYDLAAA